jgi:hypothetical protein
LRCLPRPSSTSCRTQAHLTRCPRRRWRQSPATGAANGTLLSLAPTDCLRSPSTGAYLCPAPAQPCPLRRPSPVGSNRAVDIGTPAELGAEQHLDRIVEELGQVEVSGRREGRCLSVRLRSSGTRPVGLSCSRSLRRPPAGGSQRPEAMSGTRSRSAARASRQARSPATPHPRERDAPPTH